MIKSMNDRLREYEGKVISKIYQMEETDCIADLTIFFTDGSYIIFESMEGGGVEIMDEGFVP